MTAKLKVTLHKAASLPSLVKPLTGPLLETYDSFVISGFAVPDYLDTLADKPSAIFAEGASVDLALADAFVKSRRFLMSYFEVTEEESIVIMSTSVDFGITQIVDGNWGVHAIIPKWVFSEDMVPYDYKCTQNPAGTMKTRSRRLDVDGRKRKLQGYGVQLDPEQIAEALFRRVTHLNNILPTHEELMHKWVDAKIATVEKVLHPEREPIPSAIKKALLKSGAMTPVHGTKYDQDEDRPGEIELFNKGLI